ncbi:hypothetical protein MXB_1913, partial [Myxobolus squamalis]
STQPASSANPQFTSLVPHSFLNVAPPLQSISIYNNLVSESCLNMNDSVSGSTKNGPSSDPSLKPPLDVMDFIDLQSTKLNPSYSNNLIASSTPNLRNDISYNIDNLDLDLNSFQDRVVTGDIDHLFNYFENISPSTTFDNGMDFSFSNPTTYPNSFDYNPSNTFDFSKKE